MLDSFRAKRSITSTKQVEMLFKSVGSQSVFLGQGGLPRGCWVCHLKQGCPFPCISSQGQGRSLTQEISNGGSHGNQQGGTQKEEQRAGRTATNGNLYPDPGSPGVEGRSGLQGSQQLCCFVFGLNHRRGLGPPASVAVSNCVTPSLRRPESQSDPN